MYQPFSKAFLNTKDLVESAQMAEQMDSLPEMNISFGALADAVSMTAGASNEMCNTSARGRWESMEWWLTGDVMGSISTCQQT